MKKLIIILLISVAGVSCKKDKEEQKACWECVGMYAPNNSQSEEVGREEVCDKTETEIRANENDYNSKFGPAFTKYCTFKRPQ